MADRVGQLLGNYRLTRLPGQGGFAEVYQGKHIHLKTLGAIKLLHTRGAHQKELEDFLREAQAIAQGERGRGPDPSFPSHPLPYGTNDVSLKSDVLSLAVNTFELRRDPLRSVAARGGLGDGGRALEVAHR